MRAPLAAALLCAGVASAQTVARIESSEPPRPPQAVLIELKLGSYKPRIADEGLRFDPYREVFGGKRMLYGGGEIDWLAWRGFGSVGVGFSVGYAEKYAPALLQSNGGLSAEKTALIVFPLRLALQYRFDAAWDRWGVPFVPYVKGALLATPWRVTKGGDTEVANGKTGSGLKWGYGFTGGLAFVLDVLSPRMARDLQNDVGIRHSYLFAEWNDDHIDDFGKRGLVLSSRWWTFGLGFEL